jgi:NNP family nitrate/nitrite transporter-like MFS transporter
MNLFARTLGGYLGDFWGDRLGTTGRVQWLFITLFFEGISLVIFSQMRQLFWAVLSLVVFSIAVKMAQGATFAVVPFVNRQALGSVTGVVAAGGNVGAVLAGFLLKAEALTWPVAFFLLGLSAIAASIVALAIRFDAEAVAVGSEALSQTGVGPVGAS